MQYCNFRLFHPLPCLPSLSRCQLRSLVTYHYLLRNLFVLVLPPPLSVIPYQFNPLDFTPSNSSLAAGGDDITETLTAKAYRRRDLLSYVAIVSGRLKRSLPAEKTAGQSPRMSVDYNRLRKYSNIRLSPDLNQKFVPMVSVSDN